MKKAFKILTICLIVAICAICLVGCAENSNSGIANPPNNSTSPDNPNTDNKDNLAITELINCINNLPNIVNVTNYQDVKKCNSKYEQLDKSSQEKITNVDKLTRLYKLALLYEGVEGALINIFNKLYSELYDPTSVIFASDGIGVKSTFTPKDGTDDITIYFNFILSINAKNKYGNYVGTTKYLMTYSDELNKSSYIDETNNNFALFANKTIDDFNEANKNGGSYTSEDSNVNLFESFTLTKEEIKNIYYNNL